MFLAVSLTSCKTCEPIVRTETVTVKVPTYVALKPELTRVEPEPKKPAGTLTNNDLATMIDELREWGRGLAGQLQKIQGLQPKGAP